MGVARIDTLPALVRAGREREGVAIDAPDRSAPYSYRDLCTNAWKAGNLLGHYTHPGGQVAVVVGPKARRDHPEPSAGSLDREGELDAADPLLAVLGGTLVGATVTVTPETPVEADVLVRPAGVAWRERYPARPGCSTLAYGGPPEEAAVEAFEAALWSENPIEPPECKRIERTTPALRAGSETHTHGDLLDRAAEVVDRHGLGQSSRALLAGDLREVAVLAGVLGVLSVGGSVLLADGERAIDDVALVLDGSHGRKE